MAKPRKLSDAQKLRILERTKAKHAAAIARVNAKIEACETCSVDKLQRDLGRLDADYQRDRKALESKYGVTLPSKAAKKTSKKKTAKKAAEKAAKKKTAKKKTAKRNAQSGKSPKKKAARKAAKAPSAKKAGKKSGKKTSKAKPASFMVHVYDSAADVRPVWSGPLSQYMDDNADAIDDATAAKIWALTPGKTIKVDLGAGGLSKIRRAKSEYRG